MPISFFCATTLMPTRCRFIFLTPPLPPRRCRVSISLLPRASRATQHAGAAHGAAPVRYVAAMLMPRRSPASAPRYAQQRARPSAAREARSADV